MSSKPQPQPTNRVFDGFLFFWFFVSFLFLSSAFTQFTMADSDSDEEQRMKFTSEKDFEGLKEEDGEFYYRMYQFFGFLNYKN